MATLEKTNLKTTTYTYDDNYMVDIVETESGYDAYLYDRRYGHKEMMFGYIKGSKSMDDFIEELNTKLETGYYQNKLKSRLYLLAKREERLLTPYVVASSAEPTCIVVANNMKEAIKIAQSQALKDLDCEQDWEAYEVTGYFSDSTDPEFFGWVKDIDSKYI